MLGTVEGRLYVVCSGHICLTGRVSSVKDIDELGSVGGRGEEMLTWNYIYNFILTSL